MGTSYSLFYLLMKKYHITAHLARKQRERKRMALAGKTVTEKFGEETFIFQHPGIEAALDIQDNSKDENGKRVSKLLFKEFLEHVIFVEKDGVPQKVDLAYFEKFGSMKVFNDVVSYASKFLFR